MRKRKGLVWIILALAIVGSFYFDAEISKIFSLTRNYILNEFFLGITFVSSEVIILFFLTSLFLWQERKRKWIIPLWVTLGVGVIISFILKITVQRLRPFQEGIVSTLPSLESAHFLSWNFSFPSFQTMLAFSAIPILSKEFPKLRYFWIIFAVLVAFSRVYFGLHFMSDVLVGGVMGYIIGKVVVYEAEERRR